MSAMPTLQSMAILPNRYIALATIPISQKVLSTSNVSYDTIALWVMLGAHRAEWPAIWPMV